MGPLIWDFCLWKIICILILSMLIFFTITKKNIDFWKFLVKISWKKTACSLKGDQAFSSTWLLFVCHSPFRTFQVTFSWLNDTGPSYVTVRCFMHISVNNTHGLISYFQCSEFCVFYNVSYRTLSYCMFCVAIFTFLSECS